MFTHCLFDVFQLVILLRPKFTGNCLIYVMLTLKREIIDSCSNATNVQVTLLIGNSNNININKPLFMHHQIWAYAREKC